MKKKNLRVKISESGLKMLEGIKAKYGGTNAKAFDRIADVFNDNGRLETENRLLKIRLREFRSKKI